MASEQKKIRVALADDHTLFRKGVRTILSSAPDLTILAEASNGVELLQALENGKQAPDVCVLDVNMPEMNGHETLVELRKRYPGIRVLILTMMDHELIIVQMLRAGASGYLLKDSEPDELLEAIRHLANHDFYLNELVSGRTVSWLRKDGDSQRFDLTDIERRFLIECVSEKSYKEIAADMNISIRTLENCRDALFRRLQTSTRIGLALYAIRLGLVNV